MAFLNQPVWRLIVEAVLCSVVIGAILFELGGDNHDAGIMDKAVKWSEQAKQRSYFATQATKAFKPAGCGASSTGTTISGVTGTCASVASNWGTQTTCCSTNPSISTGLAAFDSACSNYACKSSYLQYYCTFGCKPSSAIPCLTDLQALADACTTACPKLVTAGYVPSSSTISTWAVQNYGNATTTFTSSNAGSCQSFVAQTADTTAPVINSLLAAGSAGPVAVTVNQSSSTDISWVWTTNVVSNTVPNVMLALTYVNSTDAIWSGYFPTSSWAQTGNNWTGTLTTILSTLSLPAGTINGVATASNGVGNSISKTTQVVVTGAGSIPATLPNTTLCPAGSTQSGSATLPLSSSSTNAGLLDCQCSSGCSYTCTSGCTLVVQELSQTGATSTVTNTLLSISGLVSPKTGASTLSLVNSPMAMLGGSSMVVNQAWSIICDTNSQLSFATLSKLSVSALGNLGLTGTTFANSASSAISGLVTVTSGTYQMAAAGAKTVLTADGNGDFGKLIVRNAQASTTTGWLMSAGSVISGTGSMYLAGGKSSLSNALALTNVATSTTTTALPTQSNKFTTSATAITTAASVITTCNAIVGTCAGCTAWTTNNAQLIVSAISTCILTTANKNTAFGGAIPADMTTDQNTVTLQGLQSTLVGYTTFTVGSNSALTFDGITPTGTRMLQLTGMLNWDATAVAEGLVASGSTWPTTTWKVTVARFKNTANNCPVQPAAITTRSLTNTTCPSGRQCWFQYENEKTGTPWCRLQFVVSNGTASNGTTGATLYTSNTTFVNINKDCAAYSPEMFVSDMRSIQSLQSYEIVVLNMVCGSMTVFFQCRSFTNFATAQNLCNSIVASAQTPGSALWNKLSSTSPALKHRGRSDNGIYALFVLILLPFFCVSAFIGFYKSKQREADNQYLQDTSTFANVASHGAAGPYGPPIGPYGGKEMLPFGVGY